MPTILFAMLVIAAAAYGYSLIPFAPYPEMAVLVCWGFLLATAGASLIWLAVWTVGRWARGRKAPEA